MAGQATSSDQEEGGMEHSPLSTSLQGSKAYTVDEESTCASTQSGLQPDGGATSEADQARSSLSTSSGNRADVVVFTAQPAAETAYGRNGMYEDQKCLVCETPASGFHYRRCTCEPCKLFFRRTVLSNLMSTCRWTGKCKITASTRKLCRSCRFEKCLAIGMDRNRVMDDEKRRAYNAKRAAGKQKTEKNEVERIGHCFKKLFADGNKKRCLEEAKQGSVVAVITNLVGEFLRTCSLKDIWLLATEHQHTSSWVVKVTSLWQAHQTSQIQLQGCVWTLEGITVKDSTQDEEMAIILDCILSLSISLRQRQLDENELGLALLVAVLKTEGEGFTQENAGVLEGLREHYFSLILQRAEHKTVLRGNILAAVYEVLFQLDKCARWVRGEGRSALQSQQRLNKFLTFFTTGQTGECTDTFWTPEELEEIDRWLAELVDSCLNMDG